MADFAQQVRTFTEDAKDKTALAVQRIALEMFERVILRSPVGNPSLWKTPRPGYVGGRFRGNWQVAIGSVPTGTLELTDATGQATINKAQAAALSLEPGQSITLVNNLPYAQRLEDGYSSQAPAGMVALTVQDFQEIARQVGVELVRI